jgi:hypothetical protein
MSRYAGKRFAGFLASVGIVAGGFFAGDPANFATLATTVALLYGVYTGGQSYTDSKNGAAA